MIPGLILVITAVWVGGRRGGGGWRGVEEVRKGVRVALGPKVVRGMYFKRSVWKVGHGDFIRTESRRGMRRDMGTFLTCLAISRESVLLSRKRGSGLDRINV